METAWHEEEGNPAVEGRFVAYKTLDIAESRKRDMHVYKPAVRLEMKIPDSVDRVHQPLKPHNKAELIRRFPAAWEEFTRNSPAPAGTKISDLPGIDKNKALTISISGYPTIEDYSNVPDETCESMGFGFRTIRDDCKKWLQSKPKKRGRPRKKPIDDTEDSLPGRTEGSR